MMAFLRSVLTDYVFYEPITLDRRLPCVKVGAHWGKKKKKRLEGGDEGIGSVCLYIYIIKGRNNNRVQDFLFSTTVMQRYINVSAPADVLSLSRDCQFN